MEDLRKRLEFGNPFIQEQAVWKLLSEVEKKRPKDKITTHTPEIPELKLLWEIASGDTDTKALTACHVLLQLVLSETADFTYVFNGILNVIPSARSLGGLVATLGELLLLQALVLQEADKDRIYRCPYTLRSPTHPFITVLTNRATSWPLLLAQVENICLRPDTRVQKLSVEVLKPFLKFVLLEPCPSHLEAPLIRERLQHLLVDICARSGDSSELAGFLVCILPCYQVSTREGVASLTDHVRQLLHLLQGCTSRSVFADSRWDRARADVALAALCLVLPNVRHKLDAAGLVTSLLSAQGTHPKILTHCRAFSEFNRIMMELGPFCPPAVLQMVDKALSAATVDSCGVGVAMMILPLLQFLAMPSPAPGQGTPQHGHPAASHSKTVQAAASALKKVENLIQQFIQKPLSQVKCMMGNIPDLFTESLEYQVETQLFCIVSSSPSTSLKWLLHLQVSMAGEKDQQNISAQTTCAVSAVMVVHRNADVLSQALRVLVNIARLDPTKAPYFLPLLLYCLGMETVPESRLQLLDYIPLMAQHKFCIAPILKTLQTLAGTQKLRPLAIHLMTSLWQLQDRCFPHLLKIIREDDSKSKSPGLPVDVLAKAGAIKDICRSKPEQHGAELLAPLSAVLQTAAGEEGGASCALALEGLYHLCEAEVTDIQSVWGVLSKQLASDQRLAVIEKICELFSLVPSLAVNTPEYEKFQAECITTLWTHARSSDSRVQGAAFQALASYSIDNFRVSHLPRQVCEDLYQQTVMVQQQQERENLSVDEVFTFIPGICFTRLLHSVPEPVLDDYEGFLSSMVGKEVDSLPRGIYHSSTRRQGMTRNHDKAISTIPTFINTQYERTKQPGLRPSIAAALLFSYDPPVEVGRDGRPRKHYLVKHGKQFLETFRTLLNEVPVQPSEWHRTILMPHAWQSFIERLFFALIESRKAELDLQLKHGHISEDQQDEKSNTAWLFARDSMVDIVKTASRGNPSQQANCVLALAGVIVTVSHFAASLDDRAKQDSDAATEHLNHTHWLSVGIDTILSLWNISYKPYGKLLGLCQQRSLDDRVPASTLTQATACLCLAPLIPILINTNADLVFYIMHEMTQSLPGGQKAVDMPVLVFHAGLGLGCVLGHAFEEHFSDVSGKKGMLEVWKCMNSLEDCCLNVKGETRAGCLLGLGLALTSLCGEGKTDCRVHVAVMHDKLFSLMEQTPVEHDSYQAVCFAVACITGTAYASNILPIERVNAVLHYLEMTHKQYKKVMGVGLSLGTVCFSLSKMGHPGVGDLRQVLTTQWLRAVTTQDIPPMEKITALNGLMSMIGSEQTLIVVQSGVSLVSSDLRVSDVIEAVTRIVQGSPDLGIQCNASWMLGHLYLSACSVAETRASVPPTFSYLPEASFLRAIFDFLIEAGRHGPEFASGSQVKAALKALQDDVRQVLPPVNWAGVLSPLMRMPFGDECRQLCLSLAVSQSGSSPTATMFLASWMTPPLFMTLNTEGMKELYHSLPKLVKSVPMSVLTTFLERSCCMPLAEETFDAGLAVSVLQGLSASLKIPDPPQSVMTVLFQAAGKFYSMMPSELTLSLYKSMADCLSNVPDEILDSITADDYTSGACSQRGFYVRCYLVAGGHQPITLLNSLIDSAMNSSQCNQNTVLYCLAHCFWASVRHRTETSGPMARLSWIVELLGHTRNVATGAVVLSSPHQSLSRAMEFAATVVSMALNLLTASQPLPDLGLDPGFLNIKVTEDSVLDSEGQGLKVTAALPEWSGDLTNIFLQLLPASVKKLEQTPWDQLLPKVFEWLVAMERVSDSLFTPEWKHIFKASQVMLRHNTEFRKITNWTKILASV